MTKHIVAEGVTSISHPPSRDEVLTLHSEVIAGLTGIIGRRVELKIGPSSLAFILSAVADRYPEMIKDIAQVVSEIPPQRGGRYDCTSSERYKRIREVVLEALA